MTPEYAEALTQARCRYPVPQGRCDNPMQWINGYCDEHNALLAPDLDTLFHNSLTNRGKQVLANQAIQDIESHHDEGEAK